MSMFRKEIRIGENMEYEKIPKITVVDSSYTKSVNFNLISLQSAALNTTIFLIEPLPVKTQHKNCVILLS
jgi:hypothetical protein